MKVFWSWQSDRPANLCRNVIQGALERALIALSEELELDPREEPVLDHDTKDEAGMAAIADTILEKIKGAGVFVGDITSVARTESGRELPNPNVLIELGWAWAHLSHKNIILVANKSFGPKKPEQLPFDIRHRRAAIFYSLSKNADDAEIESVAAKLAHQLKEALRTSLSDWLTTNRNSPGPTGRVSRSDDPSVWFAHNTLLQHQPFHSGSGWTDVRLSDGARLYARIVPERFKGEIPSSLSIHERGEVGLRTLGPQPSGDGGLNGDGVLRYAISERTNPVETWTATQWFRDTGELWTVDTERLSDGRFYVASFIEDATRFLTGGINKLVEYGAVGLMRIEVGAVGLKGTAWNGQFVHERGDALVDRVRVTEARRAWGQEELAEFIVKTLNQFADAYGKPRLDPNDVKQAFYHVSS